MEGDTDGAHPSLFPPPCPSLPLVGPARHYCAVIAHLICGWPTCLFEQQSIISSPSDSRILVLVVRLCMLGGRPDPSSESIELHVHSRRRRQEYTACSPHAGPAGRRRYMIFGYVLMSMCHDLSLPLLPTLGRRRGGFHHFYVSSSVRLSCVCAVSNAESRVQ